jgi:hypothetical protein
MIAWIQVFQISGRAGVSSGVLYTISNIIFLILFLIATLVQYNDPDPIQWFWPQ